MSRPTTLVACSHGTRAPLASALVSALVRAAADHLPNTEVVEMYVDVQQPALAEFLPRVPGPVVVVPLFLSGGYHLHHDIAEAAFGRPDVRVTAPLGPDPLLTDLQIRRLEQAGLAPSDAVVLAASASSDGRAKRDVQKAADALARRLAREVTVGVVGGAGVPASDAVAAARHRGRRVVVSSYLLMPGHFHRQVLSAGADLTTQPLLAGPPPDELVNLILRRFDEAALHRAA